MVSRRTLIIIPMFCGKSVWPAEINTINLLIDPLMFNNFEAELSFLEIRPIRRSHWFYFIGMFDRIARVVLF